MPRPDPAITPTTSKMQTTTVIMILLIMRRRRSLLRHLPAWKCIPSDKRC